MIGQTISHYRIVEKLGEGGMGVVYKAEDLKLGRAVALKFLPSHLLESEEHKRRFLHEARAAALLDHPNICTVYEIDEVEGRALLAMACLEGQTLKQKIAERPLPLQEALDIALQISQGLQAAHERGVVHRDIKPANIMVTPQGQVKIMDFGLAQFSDRTKLTATGMKLGTPAYMSPEQTEGKPADRRSDIWSLGVVLYEMIAGDAPFRGENETALAYGIVHTEPEPLTALRSGLPVVLDRVISKALAKNASERYQHVEDLVVDLRDLRRHSSGQTLAQRKGLISRRTIPRLIAGIIGVGGASAWLVWRFGLTRNPPLESAPFRSGDPLSLNPEANEYYLMAMTAGLSNPERRLQLLEKALAVDPKFVTARAEYALFTFLRFLDGVSDDSAVLYAAEEHLHQAARDDPGSARVHAVLGAIYLSQGRKEDAVRELEAAHKLNPDHLDTLNWRFNYHRMNGDSDEALRIAKKMVGQSPAMIPGHVQLAFIERERGNLRAALQGSDKILAQNPQHLLGLLSKVRVFIDAGDLAAARQTFELIPQQHRTVRRAQLMNAVLLAVEGKRELALEAMNADVINFAAKRIYFPGDVAEFYAVLGDTPTALDWLERAVRMGDERAEWFQRDPLLASLRSTERFKSIQNMISFRRQRRGLGKQ
jgi:serine/threonine protein kinase